MSKKLILLTLLALLGTLAPARLATATAAGPAVDPPALYFRSGALNVYTFTPQAYLRIDRGDTHLSGAEGPENLRWDVQVLRASMRAATPPPWRTAVSGTPAQNHVLAVAPGQVICVRARQHSWGSTSAWSRLSCVVRALDDQAIRRKGPVRVVRDGYYPDRRASILRPGTRMVIGGIPAGAMYGPVFTKPSLDSDGRWCVAPHWRISGQRTTQDAMGSSENVLTVLFHQTRTAGTAVVWQPYRPRCGIGGFVVVPRWVPLWYPM